LESLLFNLPLEADDDDDGHIVLFASVFKSSAFDALLRNPPVTALASAVFPTFDDAARCLNFSMNCESPTFNNPSLIGFCTVLFANSRMDSIDIARSRAAFSKLELNAVCNPPQTGEVC
jgi:hypothetical protein